jgi:hypothetical protein
MQHAPALHVAASADRDQLVVAPQDSPEPHARFILKTNTPDQHRIGSNPTATVGEDRARIA